MLRFGCFSNVCLKNIQNTDFLKKHPRYCRATGEHWRALASKHRVPVEQLASTGEHWRANGHAGWVTDSSPHLHFFKCFGLFCVFLCILLVVSCFVCFSLFLHVLRVSKALRQKWCSNCCDRCFGLFFSLWTVFWWILGFAWRFCCIVWVGCLDPPRTPPGLDFTHSSIGGHSLAPLSA